MRSEPTALSWLTLGPGPRTAAPVGGIVRSYTAAVTLFVGDQVDIASDNTISRTGTVVGANYIGVVVGGKQTKYVACDQVSDAGIVAATAGQIVLVCEFGFVVQGTNPATAVRAPINNAANFLSAYRSYTGEVGVTNTSYPVGDVRRYGARLDGVTNDRAAFVSADTNATLGIAGVGSITVPAGSPAALIGSSLTIVNMIRALPGAKVRAANGATVTVQGPVEAGHHQWIDNSLGGSVAFVPRDTASLKATWWGVKWDYDLAAGGSNGTDNVTAFQQMAAAMQPSTVAHGFEIEMPSGAARLTDGFVFNKSGVKLHGRHREATWLIFDPAVDGKCCITFARTGSQEFFGGEISDFRIASTSTNDRQKIGVRTVDVSEFRWQNVVVNRLSSDTDAQAYPLNSPAGVRRNTNPSVGLHSQGREFLRVYHSAIFADRPIWIDNNPNYPNAPGAPTSIDLRIDSDTFHFQDLYLGTQAENEAGIVFYGSGANGIPWPYPGGGSLLPSGIQYGLNLQNFVLDGSNSFVGPGLTGIRYITTPTKNWHNNRSVRISNVRAEGMALDTGICVDIELDGGTLQGLTLENVQPGLTHGVKLRGCYDVTLREFMYSAAAAGPRNIFDFDSTCDNVTGLNVSVVKAANNRMLLGTVFVADRAVTAATANTVQSTGAGRTVNQDAGRTVEIAAGTGAGQSALVVSNTLDTWTLTANWAVQPDATSIMRVITPLRRAYTVGDVSSNNAIERNFHLAGATSFAHPHVVGFDPDNGSACYELENSNGQRFRWTAGIAGVSNNGVSLRDMTNNRDIWHAVNNVFVVDQLLSMNAKPIQHAIVQPVFGANVAIDTSKGDIFEVIATSNIAFNINAPSANNAGQRITIIIINTSGAGLGAITFNGIYKLEGGVIPTQPITGSNRSISFYCNAAGTSWREMTRSPADTAN